MDSYLVVKNGSQAESYELRTSEPSKPYLKVNSSYIGLTTETDTTWGLRVRPGVTSYDVEEVISSEIEKDDYAGYSGIKNTTGDICYLGYIGNIVSTYGYKFVAYSGTKTVGALTNYDRFVSSSYKTLEYKSTTRTTSDWFFSSTKSLPYTAYATAFSPTKNTAFVRFTYPTTYVTRSEQHQTSTTYGVDYINKSFKVAISNDSDPYPFDLDPLFNDNYYINDITNSYTTTSVTYLGGLSSDITALTTTTFGLCTSSDINSDMSSISTFTGTINSFYTSTDYNEFDSEVDNVTSLYTHTQYLINKYSSTCNSSCVMVPKRGAIITMTSTLTDGYKGYLQVDYNKSEVIGYKGYMITGTSDITTTTINSTVTLYSMNRSGTRTSIIEPKYSITNSGSILYRYSGETLLVRSYTGIATVRDLSATSKSEGFMMSTYSYGPIGSTYTSEITRQCTGNYKQMAWMIYPNELANNLGSTTVNWNNSSATVAGWPSDKYEYYTYNISSSNSIKLTKYIITTYYNGTSVENYLTNSWNSYYKESDISSLSSITTTSKYREKISTTSSDEYCIGYGTLFDTDMLGYRQLDDSDIIYSEIATSSYRRVAANSSQGLIDPFPLYRTITYTREV